MSSPKTPSLHDLLPWLRSALCHRLISVDRRSPGLSTPTSPLFPDFFGQAYTSETYPSAAVWRRNCLRGHEKLCCTAPARRPLGDQPTDLSHNGLSRNGYGRLGNFSAPCQPLVGHYSVTFRSLFRHISATFLPLFTPLRHFFVILSRE